MINCNFYKEPYTCTGELPGDFDQWCDVCLCTLCHALQAKLDEAVRLLTAIIDKRACSDGGCKWRRIKGGMHTNGGCRNDKMSKPELRRELRVLGVELNEVLASLNSESEGG